MRLTGQDKPNCDRSIRSGLKILFVLAILFWHCFSASADPLDGTSTYRDYLFVLVHGVHGKAGMWDGTLEDGKYREMFGNLKESLEKNVESGGLGFKGRVYCYTFSNPDGSNLINAREFGDRSYDNSVLGGKDWLSKARNDFITWFKDPKKNLNNPSGRIPTEAEIPSRYIILTHSMGNLSVRSYIYSDYLSRRGLFERGFYQDDIDKVVFIAPPFLGSEAIFGSALKYSLAYERLKEVAAASSFLGDFLGNLGRVSWGDPSFVYNLAKKWAAYRVYEEEVWDSLKAVLQGDMVGMGAVNIWDPAAVNTPTASYNDYDQAGQEILENEGITFLRFTNKEIFRTPVKVLARISEALSSSPLFFEENREKADKPVYLALSSKRRRGTGAGGDAG